MAPTADWIEVTPKLADAMWAFRLFDPEFGRALLVGIVPFIQHPRDCVASAGSHTGILRGRDECRYCANRLQAGKVSTETETPTSEPANCGLFVSLGERPGRTRTANQTIMKAGLRATSGRLFDVQTSGHVGNG
jgi:hypothetical protein